MWDLTIDEAEFETKDSYEQAHKLLLDTINKTLPDGSLPHLTAKNVGITNPIRFYKGMDPTDPPGLHNIPEEKIKKVFKDLNPDERTCYAALLHKIIKHLKDTVEHKALWLEEKGGMRNYKLSKDSLPILTNLTGILEEITGKYFQEEVKEIERSGAETNPQDLHELTEVTLSKAIDLPKGVLKDKELSFLPPGYDKSAFEERKILREAKEANYPIHAQPDITKIGRDMKESREMEIENQEREQRTKNLIEKLSNEKGEPGGRGR
ncbi:hypothetical protein RLOatenuis_8330 [Rickettsiales bacterium]|nr:hypothetical protein RLOatenuis_8330 [Rickettsiales bacterium]